MKSTSPANNWMPLIQPKRLRPGDTIALIRPGSRLDPKAFDGTVKALRSLGFCTAVYPKKWKPDSRFSGSDELRAEEFNWAFSQPGVRAIWASRGGYGSQRMIESLNASAIDLWEPKILLGYSDLTYAHQWLQNRKHWLTFHGPLCGFLDRASLKKTLQSLMDLPLEETTQTWSEAKNIGGSGSVRGKLVGGNLSLLRVSGRAQLPVGEDLILAIEDVDEAYYRIDRMLRMLGDSDVAPYIKGILLGTFHDCGKSDKKTFGFKRIEESLRRLTSGPIWKNCKFGHGLKSQRILPLGAQVEMQSRGRLRILHGVVGP